MKMIHPNELSDVRIRLGFAVDTLVAVHVAMTDGTNTADSYVDAVYGVADHIMMLLNEMDCILEGKV